MPNKARVFVDASVLFAAAYSNTGSARDLILQAITGRIETLVSRDVLEEVERNIGRKAPELLPLYRQLLLLLGSTVVADPLPEDVRAAAEYVAHKDAAIVAAAVQARADYLVTYDRKHLLVPQEVASRSGLAIVTPAEVLEALGNRGDGESRSTAGGR